MKHLEKQLSSAVQTIISTIVQLAAANATANADGGNRTKAPRIARKRKRILCGVNDCRKPGRGPKYGWKCDAHATIRPKKAKSKKASASRKVARAA
jgi:hypothetical protein